MLFWVKIGESPHEEDRGTALDENGSSDANIGTCN